MFCSVRLTTATGYCRAVFWLASIPRRSCRVAMHGRNRNDLVNAGVSVFVDLTEPRELHPYAHKIGAAKHLRFPIRDHSVPKSDQLIQDTLDAVDDHLNCGDMVYVHCWGGIGRTGLIVGCWLARHGLAGEKALTRLDKLWQSCPKSRYRESPETQAQKAVVRNWKKGM